MKEFNSKAAYLGLRVALVVALGGCWKGSSLGLNGNHRGLHAPPCVPGAGFGVVMIPGVRPRSG